MLLNLNNRVVLELTEEGRQLFPRQFDNLFHRTVQDVQEGEEYCDANYNGWRSGKVVMPLWDAMSIFGPFIRFGSSPPIRTSVELLDKAPQDAV